MKINQSIKKFRNNLKMRKMLSSVMRNRKGIIEDFSKAYLAETGLRPSQVVMVEKRINEDNKIVFTWHFEKRKAESFD